MKISDEELLGEEHPGIKLMIQVLEMSRTDGPDSVGIAALHEIWFSNYPTGILRSDRTI
jgi:hypothetical protein